MFTDEEMDAAITLAYESGGRKAWWVGLCVAIRASTCSRQCNANSNDSGGRKWLKRRDNGVKHA